MPATSSLIPSPCSNELLSATRRPRWASLAKSALGASVAVGALTAGLASIALGAAPVQAQSIDTTSSWDGINAVRPWGPGEGKTATYGQIITPSISGKLTDFTFYISPEATNDPINYQAHVYQWDYTGGPGVWGPTGPSLYDSGTLAFSGTSGTFLPVTTSTGGLAVSAGTSYVLFLSTVGESNTNTIAGTAWGYIASDVYPGGDFVFSNDPTSYTTAWDSSFGTGNELAFKANINEDVPGPVPLFGAAAAFGFSRKLRSRIKTNKGVGSIANPD